MYSTEQKEIFRRNLKLLMNYKKCKIDDVAKACDINARTFKSYYYGEKFPNPKRLERIALYFNMPIDALFETDNPISTKRKMEQTYHQIQGLLEERKKVNPSDIIDNYIFKHHSTIHFAFLRMCEALDITVEYIPTMDNEEIQELCTDDEYDTDDIGLIYKQETNKFMINSDVLGRLYDKDQDNGISPNETLKKLQSIQDVVTLLESKLAPTRTEDVYKKTGLKIIAEQIEEAEKPDKKEFMQIDDIPIMVRISSKKDISSMEEIKKYSLSDLQFEPKEFSLSEFVDLEDNLTSNLFDMLFS